MCLDDARHNSKENTIIIHFHIINQTYIFVNCVSTSFDMTEEETLNYQYYTLQKKSKIQLILNKQKVQLLRIKRRIKGFYFVIQNGIESLKLLFNF